MNWVTGGRKAKVALNGLAAYYGLPRIQAFRRGATESYHGKVRGLHVPFTTRSEVGYRPAGGPNRMSTHNEHIAEKYRNSSVRVGNNPVTNMKSMHVTRHSLQSSRPRSRSATAYRARSSRVPISKCGEYTHARVVLGDVGGLTTDPP